MEAVVSAVVASAVTAAVLIPVVLVLAVAVLSARVSRIESVLLRVPEPRGRNTQADDTVVGTRLAGPTTETAIAPTLSATSQMAGSYTPGKSLSRGVISDVSEAVDNRNGTAVAFKRPVTSTADRALNSARVTREGTALRAVRDRHVVTLHDAGELDDVPFVATRLLLGGSLAQQMGSHPDGMEPATAARIVEQVAAGLEATHRAGWVHRDVKASNVLYDPTSDTWVLADFGIAQPIGESAHDRLTDPKLAIGTPTHMAPELLSGRNANGDGTATPASDVYALAVLAHQLLTGQLPVDPHADLMALVNLHLYGAMPAVSARHPHLGAFDDVLAGAWVKDPAQRYPTPGAFAAAFADAGSAAAPAASDTRTRTVTGPAPASTHDRPRWAMTPAPPRAPRRAPRWRAVAAAALAVVAVGAGLTAPAASAGVNSTGAPSAVHAPTPPATRSVTERGVPSTPVPTRPLPTSRSSTHAPGHRSHQQRPTSAHHRHNQSTHRHATCSCRCICHGICHGGHRHHPHPTRPHQPPR